MGFFRDLFYSDHSRYSEYSNSHLERAYDRASNKRVAKGNEIKALKNQIQENYNSVNRHYEENLSQLRGEKNYPALSNSSPENILNAVKADMQRELQEEIAREESELAEIDKMLARINELEMQAKSA